MEFVGGDEDAAAALEQAGERAAHRVHEAAARLHVRRQDAARPEQEAQAVPHFRVFRVSVLSIQGAGFAHNNQSMHHRAQFTAHRVFPELRLSNARKSSPTRTFNLIYLLRLMTLSTYLKYTSF